VSICHENHEMPHCPRFCQLIVRKIIRIVATRYQIFGGKNVQNSILAGAPPQTPFGELTALLYWWSLQRSH